MISESNSVTLSPDKISDSVNFTCIATITDPVRDWVWVLEEKILEANDRYKISQTISVNSSMASSTLQILNPRKTDEGRYKCLINYVESSSIIASQTHYLRLEGIVRVCKLSILNYVPYSHS